MDKTSAAEPDRVAGVQFDKCGKAYHFDCRDFPDLRAGDFVIVETSRGRQMGQVVSFAKAEENGREYKPILRLATPQDLVGYQTWQAKAEEALATCKQKADELGGFANAKFIQAVYNFDGSMLTIFYSTEDKVSVSQLRTALRRSFRTKIDFRQIGPRDVAKALEGYGACGIVRCCTTFLTEFCPISIKMAKSQSISLNPSEITGVCGRLRCCLLYEYEQYVEALKSLPKKGKWAETPYGVGKVVDLLPMEDAAVVMVDKIRHTVPSTDLVVQAPPAQQQAAKPEKSQKESLKANDDRKDKSWRKGKR